MTRATIGAGTKQVRQKTRLLHVCAWSWTGECDRHGPSTHWLYSHYTDRHNRESFGISSVFTCETHTDTVDTIFSTSADEYRFISEHQLDAGCFEEDAQWDLTVNDCVTLDRKRYFLFRPSMNTRVIERAREAYS